MTHSLYSSSSPLYVKFISSFMVSICCEHSLHLPSLHRKKAEEAVTGVSRRTLRPFRNSGLKLL